jgi:NAD-dependent dihydropyrimidine dehydrogenase PreA subunit
MSDKHKELAARIALGASERIPELFEMIADESEAELLLALPSDPDQLARNLGRSAEDVEQSLKTLFVKGLVFPSHRTDPPTYRMSKDLVQFHDASILWPDAPKEFLDLWQEFMEVEWPDIAKVFSQMVPRPFTRVIPVGVTLPAKTHVLAHEDIEEIIYNSRNLAVTKCTCRMTANACDKPLETCLQVNRAADYTLNRGTGRPLTKEEALALMKDCEEEGLIHVVINKQDVDHFICNCCGCCCQTMPILIKHGVSVVAPSRFMAGVDPETCIGCGTCEQRCYVGAIGVGDSGCAEVIADKCLGCGVCKVTCPSGAIEMIEVREKDFVPEKLFGK